MTNFILKLCFLIIFGRIEVIFSHRTSEIEAKSRAISSLIDNLHETHQLRFILIVEKNDSYLEKLCDRILRNTKSPISVKFLIKLKRYFVEWEYSYIFLVKKENLHVDWIETRKYHSSENYVFIHPKNADEESIKNAHLAATNVYKVSFLVTSLDKQSLLLRNMIRLTPESCEYQGKTVNSFKFDELKWTKLQFVPEFENFHRCPVGVFVITKNDEDDDDKYLSETSDKGKTEYHGIFIEILNLFASKHNMSLDQQNSYQITTQLTVSTVMTRFHSESFGEITTPPITYEYLTYAVSRGQHYTPFEKLLLPFDLATWMMIIATFAIGFLTILIIYQFPRSVQQFIFGTNNSHPSLCLTQIFFGLGLIQAPDRNFARFLFMIFTLFCLIIRNAYQGKMFEFLHSNTEKHTPNSRDELIEQNVPVHYEISAQWTHLERKYVKDHPM